jgi:hypothetical protein
MRWLAALLILLPATMSVAQVRSAEPLAPGLPFTGPDGPIWFSQVSADGNALLYYSRASNLTPEPVTNETSLYAESLNDGVIRRIPLAIAFSSANGLMSGDGNRVAFTNSSAALLYDKTTGRLQNIGILPDGTQVAASVHGLSTDGTTILLGLSNKLRSGSKYYVRNTVTGRTTGVQTNSSGDSISITGAQLTGDGKSIFFTSSDPRLPKGNAYQGIYRKSLDTGVVELVDGSGANFSGVDATGKTLLLNPNHLTKYYSLLDTETKVRTYLERDLYSPKLSGDGTIVVGTKVTRLDDVTGTIVAYHVASRNWTTVRSQEKTYHIIRSISRDGSRIAYQDGLCDLNGVEYSFARTNLPGFANNGGGAEDSSVSGTKVILSSTSSNLVNGVNPDEWQIFLRDVATQITSLESLGSDSQPVRGKLLRAALSGDGRYLSYIVQRESYEVSRRFVLVVRDVVTKRNVASYEFFGSLISVKVKNDGRTVVMFENFGVKTNLFDPKTGKVSDLTNLMPPGYNHGPEYLQQLWVGADDDLVFFGAESDVEFDVYLVQINVGSQQSQVYKLPAISRPINVSRNGKIAAARGADGSFYVINLDTKALRKLPINAPLATAHLSGNGRYVGINRFIIDLEEPRGWFIEESALAFVSGVLNTGDPIVHGYGVVNGVYLANRRLPFILRLGTPDPTPLTFVTPAATIVKGVVNMTTTGVSFSEPTTSLKFQYRIGTDAWTAPGPALTSLTLKKDGVHEVAVRCVDSAGRMDPTPATFTVTSDTVAPTMTVNIKTTSDGAKFTATASEHCTWTLKVNYTFDGVEPVLGPWSKASHYWP